MVVRDTKPDWRSVTSRAHQVSIKRPVLLDFFITNMDDRIECTLSRLYDARICGQDVTMPDSCDTIQKNLDKL